MPEPSEERLVQLEQAILAVLDSGPLHGYAIYQELRERGLDFPVGILYPTLRRLVRLGGLQTGRTVADGRERRRYWLARVS